MSRSGWAPQPKVCWYCGVHSGTKHKADCVFEGVFNTALETENTPLICPTCKSRTTEVHWQGNRWTCL